jgi:hypothetical protein
VGRFAPAMPFVLQLRDGAVRATVRDVLPEAAPGALREPGGEPAGAPPHSDAA